MGASMDRLQQLHDAGQSIWLDFIDRTLLRSGELARRIEREALTGMTSNPTIFEKALAEGTAYDAQLAGASPDLNAWELFELIETDDVRAACDIFRPVHEKSRGTDGFASIEVSPGSAHDVEDTIVEARRLWAVVDRPNVMIKVPGTPEGAAATRRLLAEGINVNITLLFSIDAHATIIESYLSALEERASRGLPLSSISSVASFFVSRVDTEGRRRRPSADAWRWPTRSSPTRSFASDSPVRGGRHSRRAARACSGRSGRARARRTLRIATSCTWRISSVPTR